MNPRRIFKILLVVTILLIVPSLAVASSSASILYQETQQEDGLWHYEFTFSNTSTNNEYLYSVWLNFVDMSYTILEPMLPAGWTGPWGKINPASFEETHTSTNKIAAGNELEGFGFVTDQKIPDITYTAYFINHNGTISTHSDTSVLENIPVVPEPLSAILFVVGGVMVGTAAYVKRRRINTVS